MTLLSRPRSRTALAGIVAISCLSLFAQETQSPTPRADAPATPVFELSPFTVTAESDTGYRAGGTLSGTRLRTDLKDVAAAVTVVTKDFMQDLAADDLEDVLVYTVGTEVAGLGGNISAAEVGADRVSFDNANRSPSSTTRVRGLSGADTTRDFFLTDLPMDGYNTDRVEINRGPNAMLFGLGSPGGIINSNLIQARADRTKTKIGVMFGSFGTHRETLDHNQVLVENKLAVRIAALHGNEEFQQDPAFIKNERLFGTVTFRPFANTTIRAHTEWARTDSNKPRVNPPGDSYTWWWQVGRPTYDPTTGLVTLLGPAPSNPSLNARNANGTANTSVIRSQIGAWNVNPALILEDPNVAVFGITGVPGAQALEGRNERVRLTGSGAYATDGMRSLNTSKLFLQLINGGAVDPRFAFWREIQITDPTIFNFYDEMLEGPNKNEWSRWKTYNLTLEQRLFGGAGGFEVAYDRQNLDSGYHNPFQGSAYAITMDINSKLPNGQANPNVGRAIVADSGFSAANVSDREAFRGTAYYTLDFRKLNKSWLTRLLGQHTFTGNYTHQQQETEAFGGRNAMMGLDHYEAEAATFAGTLAINATTARRSLLSASYLGPSMLGALSPTELGLQGIRVNNSPNGLTTVGVLYYQSPASNTTPRTLADWEVRPFSVITNQRGEVPATGSFTVGRTRNEFESLVFISQGRWWDDTLISTVGWRRDAFETYDAGAADFDPATGLRIVDPAVWFPKLTLEDVQTSFSYGGVLHLTKPLQGRLPEDTTLSLTYNVSDNFRPTSQRYNQFGDAIEAQSGDTKEYGILVTTLGGRVELRATHYETASTLATNGNLTNTKNRLVREVAAFFNSNAAGNNADRPAAVAAWNAWAETAGAQQFFETFNFVFSRNPDGSVSGATQDDRVGVVVSTSDVVAKGWEYEAVINPTRNWRIALNAARQEAVRSNTGADYQALLADFGEAFTGPAGTIRSSANGTTLSEFYATNLAELQKEVLLDGSPAPELRKWRWNAVTNYSFTEGRLDGWNVGGAVRWQDKSVLGFPVIVAAGGPQIDVSAPYFGPSEVNYDAWVGYRRTIGKNKIAWRVQLNVKNIGVGNELIPVSAQPDGSIAAYRIAQPQTWTLTNTFEF